LHVTPRAATTPSTLAAVLASEYHSSVLRVPPVHERPEAAHVVAQSIVLSLRLNSHVLGSEGGGSGGGGGEGGGGEGGGDGGGEGGGGEGGGGEGGGGDGGGAGGGGFQRMARVYVWVFDL